MIHYAMHADNVTLTKIADAILSWWELTVDGYTIDVTYAIGVALAATYNAHDNTKFDTLARQLAARHVTATQVP